MPQVSVIIPAYKAEYFIADAVASVLQQSFKDFEVVIASDDAQDYLSVLAGQGICDARIRCVSTGGVATGVANARNAALDKAFGRIIATLDADDVYRRDALAVSVPLASRWGAAYSNISFVHFDGGQALPNYNRTFPAGPLSLAQVQDSCIHTYAWIVFDRERLPGLHWREDIRYWNDLIVFAEACDGLGQLYYSPEKLYEYRHRAGSLCNSPGAAAQFMKDVEIIEHKLNKSPSFLSASHDTREVLKDYMHRWQRMIHSFEEAARADPRIRYQDFLRDNLSILYHGEEH